VFLHLIIPFDQERSDSNLLVNNIYFKWHCLYMISLDRNIVCNRDHLNWDNIPNFIFCQADLRVDAFVSRQAIDSSRMTDESVIRQKGYKEIM